MSEQAQNEHLNDIAIVGMTGRFPGAENVAAYWKNLLDGVEAEMKVDVEQWAALRNVHPSFYDDPRLVKARPSLKNIDQFDAAFFGYTPREAQVLDPQQRLFLECAWEALENAGYDPQRYEGAISVIAGIAQSTYILNQLQHNVDLVDAVGLFTIGLSNMNDSLATRVAYKLNLKGAAFAVQSFCSTSLVAVHLSCQSLLNHECDMAMAGGVTIAVPQEQGYEFQDGGILSPDGHTRTFDAKGQGMAFGNGLGIVVLKRLAEAVQDGDVIHAVIRGSAINNDGSLKVSYTGPSVNGQAQVITEALSAADVDPTTIGYVEAHGTATNLGDPAEIAGLTKAYRNWTDKKQYCAIGSVKTNIGHLDAAAGVASLIKTALAIKYQKIPKSLHYEKPNPQIEFEKTPFFVNDQLRDWPHNGHPRRAGVSAFGIGGTNAHVILEEAPATEPSSPATPWQLLVLSARTESALENATANMGSHLQQHPQLNLADAAYTLQVGRRVFEHRRFVVCRDTQDGIEAIRDPERLHSAVQKRDQVSVAFMFTGQGSQYPRMAQGLYDTESVFRDAVDRCCQLLQPQLELDFKKVLYPTDDRLEEATEQLNQTHLTQPALFVIEYAMANLWISWGLKPACLIGHSIGEYVAAHLAGVFSLQEALSLVAERGRLMHALPAGAMLGVAAKESALSEFIVEPVTLAAVNAPGMCVLSGPIEAIEAIEVQLQQKQIQCRRLQTSHAFHSSMMDPMLEAFTQRVAQANPSRPKIRFVSNVTGTWITDEQAIDPAYWAKHLRQAVQFADGVATIIKEDQPVLLEIGPGNTLATLARKQISDHNEQAVISSIRHPKQSEDDRAHLLGALGRLWMAGVNIDWAKVHGTDRRKRVELPTYPFERQRYWIDPDPTVLFSLALSRGFTGIRNEIRDWFYQPTWKRLMPAQVLRPNPQEAMTWLLFIDGCGLGVQLAKQLRQAGHQVITVEPGHEASKLSNDAYTLATEDPESYVALIGQLKAQGKIPSRIMHLWQVTNSKTSLENIEVSQNLGFYSALYLAQALGKHNIKEPIRLGLISSGMQTVVGNDLTDPLKATMLGPYRVISQEFKNIDCVSIDIDAPNAGTLDNTALANRLIAEMGLTSDYPIIAYRNKHRWVQWIEPTPLDSVNDQPVFKPQGVYLITGGLGGIGLSLAEHLAKRYQAKLVLTGRSPLPEREIWDDYVQQHGQDDPNSRKIRKIQELEAAGAQVLPVTADVVNLEQMKQTVEQATARFGAIHGAIHAAGVAGGGVIQLKQRSVAEKVLAPKVTGTLILKQVLREQPLEFLALCSSTAAIIGGFGQVDYTGANAFLDAYAHSITAGDTHVVSINWDAWKQVGMAVNTAVSDAMAASRQQGLKVAIAPEEGVEAFERIMHSGLNQVTVLTMDIRPVLIKPYLPKRQAEQPVEIEAAGADHDGESKIEHSDLEQVIAQIWKKILGHEKIGLHDNFFELGGDSLAALQVIAILNQRLGKEVPAVIFYEAPTISQLAKAFGQDNDPQAQNELDEISQQAESRLEKMQRHRGTRRRQKVPDNDDDE